MKKISAMLLCALLLASMLAGCDQKGSDPATAPLPTEITPTEPAVPWAVYKCITVAEALKLCEGFVDTPCNWNSKNYYTGYVLSVLNADGTKTLNFE